MRRPWIRAEDSRRHQQGDRGGKRDVRNEVGEVAVVDGWWFDRRGLP